MTILVGGCIEERKYVDHLVLCRKLLHCRGIPCMWKRVHMPASPWGAASTEQWMNGWMSEWMHACFFFFFCWQYFSNGILKNYIHFHMKEEEEEEKGGEEREGNGREAAPNQLFPLPGSWKLQEMQAGLPGFPRQTLRRGRGSLWPGASQTFWFGGGGWSETSSRSPCRQDFGVNLSPKDTGSESIALLVTHNMEFLPYCNRYSLVFIYLFFFIHIIYICIYWSIVDLQCFRCTAR